MKKKQLDPSLQPFKDAVIAQIKSGQPLFGKDGAFAPLLKSILDEALEAELDLHLTEQEREAGNRKNGKMSKSLRTSMGTIELETPRDRQGTFEPELVAKRQTILSDSLESKILSLYGQGLSLRDISKHIKEMYDSDISADALSTITDRIIPKVKEWQSRPLEEMYPIVWMDAMFYKVREDSHYVTRAVYNILAINRNGHKELIGMYVSQSEGAKFWLSVLTDLQNRGLKDILIACTDNLTGFADAINSVFPLTEVQTCVVHQIRNSLKYVASKDQKEFIKDLKPVYQADTLVAAALKLDELDAKWGKKYDKVIESWRRNWDKLTVYFKYDAPIRKLIYTTNAIEGFHRQIRKVTKTKGAFTSDMALLKLIYLAHNNIAEKWKSPLQNWGETALKLSIWFPERMVLDLK